MEVVEYTAECVIPVHNSTSEICQYMSSNCINWRDYWLRSYYCSYVNHPTISNITLWSSVICCIGLLFLILGLLASDYLVPNLSALSDALKMDEKLSGLTLLAFANGSPDILSTYIAMKQGITSMAVGELLGSANFSLTVVIGVLAIYKPFTVNQTTFMRDLIIFSLLILISLYILSDGIITIVESVVLCLLYVAFIIFNFFLPGDEFHNDTQHQNEDDDYTSREGQGVNDIDMREDNDCCSVRSIESNASMNDYYFAHNVDNLEQGRGYKIALLDSLKLAWYFHRKSAYKTIPKNDIERLQPVSVISPPKSPLICESSDGLSHNVNDDINFNVVNELNIDSLTESLRRSSSSIRSSNMGSSPSLSRSTSSRRLKNKDDYQILYPNKSAAPSRISSNVNMRSDAYQIKPPHNYVIPQIIEPNGVEFEIIDEDEPIDIHNYNTYTNRIDQGKLSEDIDRPDLLPKIERPIYANESTIHHSFSDFQSLQPHQHTESSASSSLIPYVEYNKTTSMFRKIVPLNMYTGAISIDEKILAIIIIPLSTVFNIMVPVPLPSELKGDIYQHELSISSKLFHFQLGFLPLLVFDFEITLPLIIVAMILPVISIATRYLLIKEHYELIFPSISSLIGFFSVLKLITFAATAVISILKKLAEVYQMNESILGLTFLSLGNSVGDVVTNLALAGLGRPLTGLHACFGSPLLYILFGIGICSLIVQLSASGSKSIEFTVDASLKLTAFSIVTMLLIYSVVLPLNNWIFKRWVGYVGVVVWFSVTVVNVILHRHR